MSGYPDAEGREVLREARPDSLSDEELAELREWADRPGSEGTRALVRTLIEEHAELKYRVSFLDNMYMDVRQSDDDRRAAERKSEQMEKALRDRLASARERLLAYEAGDDALTDLMEENEP